MIVVDTSALLAVLQGEPRGAACLSKLESNDEILISAGTLAEALIVATHRNLRNDLSQMITRLQIEVVPVNEVGAQFCADAHLHWGKGIHPAGLNFGDCFAYSLAKTRDCALLFIGDDFSQTDIVSVL